MNEIVSEHQAADSMRLTLELIDVYKEPTDLFSLNRLTAYNDEGDAVATVHYLFNYTNSAPQLLSAEQYDDLLQSCKEGAKDKFDNSTEVSVGKHKYKFLGFGKGKGKGKGKGILGKLVDKLVPGKNRRNRDSKGNGKQPEGPTRSKPSRWGSLVSKIVPSVLSNAVVAGPGYIDAIKSSAHRTSNPSPGTGQYHPHADYQGYPGLPSPGTDQYMYPTNPHPNPGTYAGPGTDQYMPHTYPHPSPGTYAGPATDQHMYPTNLHPSHETYAYPETYANPEAYGSQNAGV
ncbi:hypothetical protein Aduo_007815 [Ancylostoma duodenale]